MQLFNQESVIHHHFTPAQLLDAAGRANPARLGVDYAMDGIETMCNISGIGFSDRAIEQIMQGHSIGMDSQQPVTTPSIATPVQFLQNWLPGIIEVVTAARKIDELVGRATVGAWEDEQIVQQIVEMSGGPLPYGDTTNVPLAEWNPNFVFRTVVRFEQGLRVGLLEEARSARIRVNSGDQKRKSSGIQLEIARNAIGFYGYNSGNNLTYGFLNDPNLPNYVSAPNGNWATATFLEIQQDLLTAFQDLRTGSQGLIEPNKDPITLAIATDCIDYLAKTSDFGISVWDWLKQFYGNVRVVDAVQLNNANGGANVFYVYADTVRDSGTDDQRTFIQVVPSVFQLLGVQKLTKAYEEDYSNATAGVFLKRPYAVKRFTGI